MEFNKSLFIDPKIQYPDLKSNLEFEDYILKSQNIIKSYRKDLTNDLADTIIKANTPFELKPSGQNTKSQAALLIHGLLDSPLHLSDIGKLLQNKGLLVRSMLLNGHGTIPGALLNTKYTNWLESAKYGVESLAKEVNKIFLVGLSTGGAISLHPEILKHPKIAGIILFAPAIKIKSKLAAVSFYYKYLPWSNWESAWIHPSPDETIDYAKYRSMPLNAVYQVYKLTKDLDKRQPGCPIFAALSEDDKTICANSALNYFHNHTNPESKMILYSTKPKKYKDIRIEARQSHYDDLRIKNFSHTCIQLSPENTHYGAHGDYKFASHIDTEKNIVYGEFDRVDIMKNQKMREHKLTNLEYQRLSYNPDFKYMSQSILDFIDRC